MQDTRNLKEVSTRFKVFTEKLYAGRYMVILTDVADHFTGPIL